MFVNLDAGNPAPFPDSTALDLDSFASTAGLGSKSEWIAGQTLTGSFNWKFGSTFAKSSPVVPNIDLITIVSSQYCTDITTQLEETLSAAAPLSFAAKFIKIITQHNSRADSQLFPASLLYSFKDAPLWVSLSFFPRQSQPPMSVMIYSTCRLRLESTRTSSHTPLQNPSKPSCTRLRRTSSRLLLDQWRIVSILTKLCIKFENMRDWRSRLVVKFFQLCVNPKEALCSNKPSSVRFSI